MTPDVAVQWMLPIALFFSVLMGTIIISVSARTSWVKSAVALATIGYALVGGILLLAPKWHGLIAEYDGKSAKVQLASLKKQLDDSRSQNAALQTQVNLVSLLGEKGITAGTFVNAAKNTPTNIEWIKALSENTKGYKAEVDDPQVEALISGWASKPADKIISDLRASGYTVFKDVKPEELGKIKMDGLWINPADKN